MATKISNADPDFKIWEKGQFVVLSSRTKEAKCIIFIGDKNETLNALKDMLLQKTQWADYMEQVLDIVMLNSDDHDDEEFADLEENDGILNQNNFLYRICDISLPQC
eukprot:13196732-Ditylum_brightwellii.AAC.1